MGFSPEAIFRYHYAWLITLFSRFNFFGIQNGDISNLNFDMSTMT